MVKNKTFLRIIFILCGVLLFVEAIGYYIGDHKVAHATAIDKKANRKRLTDLRAENSILRSRLRSLNPDGIYIVIDTARNRLFLKYGNRTIREAIVSTGSGNILKDSDGRRKWVFDTPRGEFTVKTKYVSPSWTKPDWAFIEEDETIPKNFKDRVENGILGDYALGFGDGYFIHGTLYRRLLGRSVTHGCIRVGDEDLMAIYTAAGIGTRIYIF
ncbi:MAG: L,D-transpeptidase [Nitrospirae bacterium CG_4_9_14_3_um_filter_41_27]|nr:MAG: L,D-transpeptidase [Nitrospirae bacterium CG_4_8_14_3_um_filter_41_47]PJA80664.1 MAG: L,D-transpeptidase [Nitrospirae bacterium CG_4_9_14_3_um_filter_41_27]